MISSHPETLSDRTLRHQSLQLWRSHFADTTIISKDRVFESYPIISYRLCQISADGIRVKKVVWREWYGLGWRCKFCKWLANGTVHVIVRPCSSDTNLLDMRPSLMCCNIKTVCWLTSFFNQIVIRQYAKSLEGIPTREEAREAVQIFLSGVNILVKQIISVLGNSALLTIYGLISPGRGKCSECGIFQFFWSSALFDFFNFSQLFWRDFPVAF